MSDHDPTDTTLTDVFTADQADAATDALAKRIAHFFTVLKSAGMDEHTAGSLTESFAAMATSQHFGINVAETFGVGSIYGMED